MAGNPGLGPLQNGFQTMPAGKGTPDAVKVSR
jgi:hypothetical protein